MTLTEVVVVSGSYGAGHDVAADAIEHQLRRAGHAVRRLDVAEELPWRLGHLLRWLYFSQLRLAPGSWRSTLGSLERDGLALRVVRRLLSLLGGHLVREVAGAGLVVSTHPFASQALGEARARGALDVPVVTYLTDASVHRLWVHPAVDLHLAIHEVAAGQARALGGTAAAVHPAVPEPSGAVPDEALPWPAGRPAALVVGGSLGIGDLHRSALDLLATGLVTPVVACGTNDRLREQVAAEPGVVALGWRDDLPALMAAAACVVQNAGGMSSLESLTAGTPTLTYRPIAGHGESNAAALDRAGLVPWVADTEALRSALGRVLLTRRCADLPSAPSVVETLETVGLLTGVPTLVAA
ncbi:MGDG synthase family glycosyltransferase [Nocardioides marmoribigeumensis]|uniref:UDP-N-acetylglucosamine:LPS N-acetylglucosamine transferase n=1 Tax=Nocardioides marmoribigeumensis TaxID=433649 RepID=A0ABU2BUD9_9ACTN|nr:galactosyldiacylglycerol synthase [Nocardioides marmoribigeumensis]MDR7361896.1 UDP-N-acetylglucosamine:LPS N-acetylglucosamine transferase [Nocardioides marmoribigeumensis]